MTTSAAIRQLAQLARQGRAESLTVRPAAGGTRPVLALVERLAPAEFQSGAHPQIRVTLLNDSTAGISPAEADWLAHTIDVAEDAGGAARARGIQRAISQDEEFVTLLMM